MSVDMDLDRSALERKDRAELATIAGALGGKPTSRARKADIIDMILAAAGVGGAPAGGAAGDASAPRKRSRPDAAEQPEPQVEQQALPTDGEVAVIASEAPAPSGGGSSSADERGPVASAGAETRAERTGESGTSEAGRPEGGKSEGGRNRDRNQQGEGRNRDRNQGEGGNRDRNQQGEGRNRDRNQGGNNQGGNNQGGGNRQGGNQGGGNQGGGNRQGGNQQGGNDQRHQDDDVDGRGRRRRRRGRDRDRSAEVEEANQTFEGEPIEVTGLLDLRDEGYGFLRVKGFLPSRDDAYVSVKQVRQLGLRKGDILDGAVRPATGREKNPALLRIDKVNGQDPEVARKRPRFEDLTPLFPDEKLRLEGGDPLNMTARIIDLISPIGKGQRGLIVSPPKAGKTTVMKTIAQAIENNNPEVELMVLLVDERPEEVTDMRRSVRGTVVASTFDRPSDEHTLVAELTIERAKRLVEEGKDVVVILDGITRLARAYNLAAPATGRIMSGGIDTGALYPPKKFFGAARNVEEGGSLTILATALVETGSKMDEVIFEEFKGTGNMELRLDRKMAEKRIFPAIDVDASSTRHEELLFARHQLNQVWKLRRVLSGLAAEGSANAGLELLIDRMKTFTNNDQFLAEIAKAPTSGT